MRTIRPHKATIDTCIFIIVVALIMVRICMIDMTSVIIMVTTTCNLCVTHVQLVRHRVCYPRVTHVLPMRNPCVTRV